ncbi:HalOD1 output domain-containing protein [Halopiger goleimassiliensis]|uniref:HalOD1 output domain-containing protein n=1 Tax=Halopiger goleimassiliensis TaxID=1293048 RepID=UPI000677E20C|nr:HalOD1 output domain-containing protein [Halopiger goleimassiliensis]
MTGPPDVSDDDDVLVQRTLDTEQDAPATQLVDTIAQLEHSDPLELSPVYDCIDSLVTDLFSSPPPAEADACLTFTYQGYRIHVQQDGTATIMRAASDER